MANPLLGDTALTFSPTTPVAKPSKPVRGKDDSENFKSVFERGDKPQPKEDTSRDAPVKNVEQSNKAEVPEQSQARAEPQESNDEDAKPLRETENTAKIADRPQQAPGDKPVDLPEGADLTIFPPVEAIDAATADDSDPAIVTSVPLVTEAEATIGQTDQTPVTELLNDDLVLEAQPATVDVDPLTPVVETANPEVGSGETLPLVNPTLAAPTAANEAAPTTPVASVGRSVPTNGNNVGSAVNQSSAVGANNVAADSSALEATETLVEQAPKAVNNQAGNNTQFSQNSQAPAPINVNKTPTVQATSQELDLAKVEKPTLETIETARTETPSASTDVRNSSAVQALQRATLNAGQPAQTGVTTEFDNPAWGKAIGERVMQLASQRIQVAEIHIDPPELGPVQVRIAVNQDQSAAVTFVSAHASVRETLDMNAVRLRELFAAEGLNLVNVDVSDQSPEQRFQQEGQGGHGIGVHGADEELPDNLSVKTFTAGEVGLVDYYI